MTLAHITRNFDSPRVWRAMKENEKYFGNTNSHLFRSFFSYFFNIKYYRILHIATFLSKTHTHTQTRHTVHTHLLELSIRFFWHQNRTFITYTFEWHILRHCSDCGGGVGGQSWGGWHVWLIELRYVTFHRFASVIKWVVCFGS